MVTAYNCVINAMVDEIEQLERALEQQTRRADEEKLRAEEERCLREQAEQNTAAINAALLREREKRAQQKDTQ